MSNTTKLLELFSGYGHISKAFNENGWETYRVDWNKKLEAESHADISKITVDDVTQLCGGIPDVIWCSPDCATYSIATHRHRTLKEELKPKTEYAKQCDKTNVHMWKLIDDLLSLGTKYYFVENPRGRMRHMDFVKGRPRYTTEYCAWGGQSMKPTDIWTNYPNPNFKRCDGKHIHPDWGTTIKGDYLSRGLMPEEFCKYIANLVKESL